MHLEVPVHQPGGVWVVFGCVVRRLRPATLHPDFEVQAGEHAIVTHGCSCLL